MVDPRSPADGVANPDVRSLAALVSGLGVELAAVRDGALLVRGAVGPWLRDALAALGAGLPPPAAARAADVVEILLPSSTAELARLAAAVRAALLPEALLFDLDGVLVDVERRLPLAESADLAALAEIRPLGVVTGCPRRLAEIVLEKYGLLPHLRTVVTAEDGPGKPDPAPVRLALQRLGAASAWLLGDNPVDVTAARRAGVVPLAIEPRGIGAEAHAARLRAAGAARLVPGTAALRELLALLAPRRP
jgi:phosphoglycolate phosphatase